jgi:hypothetical protein
MIPAGDQRAMPSQQGVWCHDGPDLVQRAPPEPFGLRGEADALIVGEPKSPGSELLA